MSNTAENETRISGLVAKAQAGSPAAFDELVLMYQKPMFNLALRMVNNSEDAADLTQEIFVKAYRAIKSFEGRSKFSTWLYTLAANTCRSGLRRLSRISNREAVRLDQKRETEDGTIQVEAVDEGDTPDRGLERREMMAKIEKIMAALPEDFKMVIVLRDVQGLAYEDVAKALDCSVGTVKSRLSRARLKVKDALVREGVRCAV